MKEDYYKQGILAPYHSVSPSWHVIALSEVPKVVVASIERLPHTKLPSLWHVTIATEKQTKHLSIKTKIQTIKYDELP